MQTGTIILLGDIARLVPDRVAREFGWIVEKADSPERVRQLSRERKVVAVLFEPHTFAMSWQTALAMIRGAAPAASPIACVRFSESIQWPDLAEAGAFHAVSLPVIESEIRQSLGFVWAANTGTGQKSRAIHAA